MAEKFAVFDIDGTLVRWQLYHAVVGKLASAGLLIEGAEDKLKSARLRWKKREHLDSFHNYEQVLINVYESSLPSIKPAEFDRLVNDVVNE